MNPLHRRLPRSIITRRRVAAPLLRITLLAACALPFGGCASTSTSEVEAVARFVYQDATSAAGRKLLADLTGSALHVGLDIAAGDNVAAAIAGIQGAASAVRDYEGMPTAPSSAAIARVAADGAGVSHVAVALVPSVEALVEAARTTAARQKINISTDDIVEALARGFDAVADAKTLPPAAR